MALPLDRLPFRPRRPRPDRTPVIVFAGRFCEQKGVLYALEAVHELRREGRELEFRLIGDETMTDGGYAARVYSYIRRHGLDDCVRLLGWQNNDGCLRADAATGDIFLHPSVVDDEGRSEGGAPTSILEAQALGMPVVSTLALRHPLRAPGPARARCWCPSATAPALAEALRTLLDEPGALGGDGPRGPAHVEEQPRHRAARRRSSSSKYRSLAD